MVLKKSCRLGTVNKAEEEAEEEEEEGEEKEEVEGEEEREEDIDAQEEEGSYDHPSGSQIRTLGTFYIESKL